VSQSELLFQFSGYCENGHEYKNIFLISWQRKKYSTF